MPLLPWLREEEYRFAEPCAGTGHLIDHLCNGGLACVYAGDIQTGQDALNWRNPEKARSIITNPPWSRDIMHQLIAHFIELDVPTWLLMDADWMHTKQAAGPLTYCTDIVSVGRLRWIEGTKMDGYENSAWYRFCGSSPMAKTIFHPRLAHL